MGVSKFQGGLKGAVYVCRYCGKKTRETGESESMVGLCRKCFTEGGMENEVSDGYVTCPVCKEQENIQVVDEEFVCDRCGTKGTHGWRTY